SRISISFTGLDMTWFLGPSSTCASSSQQEWQSGRRHLHLLSSLCHFTTLPLCHCSYSATVASLIRTPGVIVPLSVTFFTYWPLMLGGRDFSITLTKCS